MQRLNRLLDTVQHQNGHPSIVLHHTDAEAPNIVQIGDVRACRASPAQPQLVPVITPQERILDSSQVFLRHLRWMLQKIALRQDIFLIGVPGHLRRLLAMRVCGLLQREVEYLSISRDTSESDLKQRREIRFNSLVFVDECVVRAAVHGRILILDGLEKAERNVLPVLNNLLENREMNLEDGRNLIHAERYDALLQTHGKQQIDAWNLVRVSEDFLVIALGLPVPRYVGFSLDPPLRSRFQARDVRFPASLVKSAFNDELPKELERICDAAEALNAFAFETNSMARVAEFSIPLLLKVSLLFKKLSNLSPGIVLRLVYPFIQVKAGNSDEESLVESCFEEILVENLNLRFSSCSVSSDGMAHVQLVNLATNQNDTAKMFGGYRGMISHQQSLFVETEKSLEILTLMFLCHSVGDFCLVGERGCGKSVLVDYFSSMLKYDVVVIPVFKDQTSRDLLLYRSVDEDGDTSWELSKLLLAAIEGKLAILDGLEQLSMGVLASLQQLISERIVILPDGRRLLNNEKFGILQKELSISEAELNDLGVYCIHSNFRIVGLARPSGYSDKAGNWITPEVNSMFPFIFVPTLSVEEEMHIISAIVGSDQQRNDKLLKLLNFVERLRQDPSVSVHSLASCFSTRQILRISIKLLKFPDQNLAALIKQVSLYPFLPELVQENLRQLMNDLGIGDSVTECEDQNLQLAKNDGLVTLGDVEIEIKECSNRLLIPQTLFYENPRHLSILMDMMRDYQLGQHLVLIGNQGVGKNKLVDFMLQTLELPREYVQLHRDSSIISLISSIRVEKGRVVYEDSPMIRAVKNGYVLVIDEADKAPAHVTMVIKMLCEIELFDIPLPDGRRITSAFRSIDDPSCIKLHPDFRLIVLANRPGFPFLGNDFYREIGDMFSCHAIENPERASELVLLRKYAPRVSQDLLTKLQDVFEDLRDLYQEGTVTYPYSTRELVNIVKHIDKYGTRDDVLQNVFDFDQYDPETRKLLIEVLERHGFKGFGMRDQFIIRIAKREKLPDPVLIESLRMASREKDPIFSDIGYDSSRSDVPMEFSPPASMHCYDSRSGEVFSELICEWRFPQNSILGMTVCQETGDVFGISGGPIILYKVDSDFLSYRMLDLDHFYSYNSTDPPRLQLSLLLPHLVCVHHFDEDFLILADWNREIVEKVTLPDLSKSSFHASKFLVISPGVGLVYWPRTNILCFIDFVEKRTRLVKLQFNIWTLLLIDPSRYVIVSTNQFSTFFVQVWIEEERGIIHCLEKSQMSPLISKFNRVSAPIRAAPNLRFITGLADCIASFTEGLPESLFENRPMHIFVVARNAENATRTYSSKFLQNTQLLATCIGDFIGQQQLELVDLEKRIFRRIEIKEQETVDKYYIHEFGKNHLCVVGSNGKARIYQVLWEELEYSHHNWRNTIAQSLEMKDLEIVVSGNNQTDQSLGDAEDSSELYGDGDGDGNSNENSNGQGSGSGGSGNGGSGGRAGEQGSERPLDFNLGRSAEKVYRLEDVEGKSVEIRQVAPKDKVNEGTKKLRSKALQLRLKELGMTLDDQKMYERFVRNTRREIDNLRKILEARERQKEEREWSKNQNVGELDESRLVDAMIGERNVFKRRLDIPPDEQAPWLWQSHPKRLHFYFDVSASMSRFNSHDGRLDRSVEAAVLIMEALSNLQPKYSYSVMGHSGDSQIPVFIEEGKLPKNEKERLEVVKRLAGHASYCARGDSSLEALEMGIERLAKLESTSDETILVLLSDANVDQYGIGPRQLEEAIQKGAKFGVNVFIIFVGTLRNQASEFLHSIHPHGHTFVCFDTKEIPHIFTKIFESILC